MPEVLRIQPQPRRPGHATPGSVELTTTLTVSRHKSSRDVFAIGRGFGGFLEIDFKKRDGYARSTEPSRQLELYRQGYCGCEFSLHQACTSSSRTP